MPATGNGKPQDSKANYRQIARKLHIGVGPGSLLWVRIIQCEACDCAVSAMVATCLPRRARMPPVDATLA